MEKHNLKFIFLVWWGWWRSWGHSLSRASRAVRAQHRVEDNELRHRAKQRQLYCLQELSWCLRTTLHSPVWCCGSLNHITLCNADDPRDLSTVSFKEKLSQHELCDFKGCEALRTCYHFQMGKNRQFIQVTKNRHLPLPVQSQFVQGCSST